ncbi:MAG: hypothetical protein QOJ94_1078 [Sphingomonadales bacterium]|nr:hypothetical protein [Sphingomonadales bacterium]
MSGYNSQDPLALLYMGKTGRWLNYEKKTGYWGPLAQQEATVAALRAKIQSLRVPDISGEWAFAATKNVVDAVSATTNAITSIEGVISRVMALLHSFISDVYYRVQFETLAQSTFESYKRDVDDLIGQSAGEVLKKIPSVVRRLQEGDTEGVSQALTTCRRILEAFADAIYSPSDATIELSGNTLKLDASKHQNRINAYIAQRTSSSSRRQKLRQNLSNLFDRVSTGVHKDVTVSEAYALFLNTYLIMGEVLQLNSSGEVEAFVE